MRASGYFTAGFLTRYQASLQQRGAELAAKRYAENGVMPGFESYEPADLANFALATPQPTLPAGRRSTSFPLAQLAFCCTSAAKLVEWHSTALRCRRAANSPGSGWAQKLCCTQLEFSVRRYFVDMKQYLLAGLLAVGVTGVGRAQQSTVQPVDTATSAAIIEQQVAAYNARNLERFLSFYADGIEVFIFPNKLLIKGKEAMRPRYAALFQKAPDLHCTVESRIVQGNTVIDKERVTGANGQTVESVAVYQVEFGKIRKVYFIQ